MVEFKKILLPVDPAEGIDNLVPYLKALVGGNQAELHLLHVIPDLQGYASFYVPHPNLGLWQEELRQGAISKLQELAEEKFPGMKIGSVEVSWGDPAEQINSYAHDQEMDIIVMSTHGRRGLEYALLGSVARKVVRGSKVPVLTICPS